MQSELDLHTQLGDYAQNFDIPLLLSQLKVLPSLYERQKAMKTVSKVLNLLKAQSNTVQRMLHQCVKLCSLIITVPPSVSSAERSFSALRRIKTYMRSTMTQARHSHLMLLHVHADRTRLLNLQTVFRKFVSKNPRDRQCVFGQV